MDKNQNDNRNQQTDRTSKETNTPGNKAQDPNNPKANNPDSKNQDPSNQNRTNPAPGNHMPNTPDKGHQVGESDKRENKNREVTATDPTGKAENTDAPKESDGPNNSNRAGQHRTENSTDTNRQENTRADEKNTIK